MARLDAIWVALLEVGSEFLPVDAALAIVDDALTILDDDSHLSWRISHFAAPALGAAADPGSFFSRQLRRRR